MSNLWKQEGMPHKGWELIDVIDVRADGQAEWETEYETCMMCGNEKIRYVHIVIHEDIDDEFRVGCVCSERMTNDYVNPKKIETRLRNTANRRTSWVKKQWKKSKNGNHYLKHEGRLLLIYKDNKTTKYKVAIANMFGHKTFDDFNKAKVAVFNGIEYLKGNGRW